MEPLRKLIPEWASKLLSADREAQTWTCPTCGIIAPLEVVSGWYARRRCTCEQRAEDERQRRAIPRTLAQALAEAQRGQTYTWLGRAWHEQALAEKTFATFERDLQPQAFEEASTFAANPQGVLALYGCYGVGKTHLLAAIANRHREADKPCLFASAVTFFDAMQDRLSHNQEYHDLIKRAIHTPLLLLDDLDKPKPSEFRQEMYYQIIDGRRKTGRPLAISCNCSPLELERFIGGAARSRLMMHLIPVEMSGMDYRLML